MYAVHGDPLSDCGMTANRMRNMVFGSPTPFSLPIGHLRMKNGGMVPSILEEAVRVEPRYRQPLYKSDVRHAINYADGGAVPAVKGRPPKEIVAVMKTSGVDNIPALLQGGEIVIPKKHAPKVAKMLKKEGIKLPGM